MRIIEWFDTFYRSTSDSHNVREGNAHKNVLQAKFDLKS